MIESITIKNIATFDQNGIEINNIGKVNFIYGANGSGKTTISNFLQDSLDQKYTDCSVRWESEIPIKTLIYNKNFREDNFGKGNINGVFTLGQATKEEIESIQKQTMELSELKEQITQKKRTLDNQIEKKRNRG
ncbi:MAG: AAA family ATPase, partial [Melioribacteraceae bacterium]|nr:AAA family ATPase [Melioribacteraceae bacterium]